jgi:hypothetical protein
MASFGAITVEETLDPGDFIRDYLRPGRPVLLKGALEGLPAADWTPESLKERFPDKVLPIEDEEVRFGEFLDGVLESSPENPAPYLRNINVAPQFPELIPDLQPGLPHTRANWRFEKTLPSWWFESGCQFFLTGPGRGFPFMHVDYPPSHTFSALTYGEKEWLVLAPDQTPHLYAGQGDTGWPVVSRVEDPFDPDLARFPEYGRAEGVRVVQEAGDVIFVPSGWWHTARSLTPTISLAWDHVSANCWKDVYRYMTSFPVFTRKNPVYQALTKTYLRSVGAWLTLRESVALRFSDPRHPGRIV